MTQLSLSPVLRLFLTFCSQLWKYRQFPWPFHRHPDETIKGRSLEVFTSSVHAQYSEELLYYECLLETTKASDIFKMIEIVFTKQNVIRKKSWCAWLRWQHCEVYYTSCFDILVKKGTPFFPISASACVSLCHQAWKKFYPRSQASLPSSEPLFQEVSSRSRNQIWSFSPYIEVL